MSSFINRLRFRSASNARSKETTAPNADTNKAANVQKKSTIGFNKPSFISTAAQKVGGPRPPLPSGQPGQQSSANLPPKIMPSARTTPQSPSILPRAGSSNGIPRITKIPAASDQVKQLQQVRSAANSPKPNLKPSPGPKDGKELQTQKTKTEQTKKEKSETSSSEEEESSSTSKENKNDQNYFSAHNLEIEACLAEKQRSKINFLQTQNDQLTEQVKDLQALLKISQNQSALNSETQTLIERLTKERDEAQAQVLLTTQIMQNTKQQEADTRRELAQELDELKDKMDRTEFIIQYKEEIWTALESEIRKVVSKDSNLMRKIESQTRILTDCLASNKVSTVAKQNIVLTQENDQALSVLSSLKKSLEQNQGELISGRLNKDQSQTQSILNLAQDVNKLCKSLQNKVGLIEDENSYLRQQIKSLTKQISLISKQQFASIENDSKEQSTAISGGIKMQQPILALRPFPMSSDSGVAAESRPSNFIGKNCDQPANCGGGGAFPGDNRNDFDFDDDLRLSEIKPRKMSRYGGQNPGNFDNELDDSWVQQSPFIDVDF